MSSWHAGEGNCSNAIIFLKARGPELILLDYWHQKSQRYIFPLAQIKSISGFKKNQFNRGHGSDHSANLKM